MASGLAMYKALQEYLRLLPIGSRASINKNDILDVSKLRLNELINDGCSEQEAQAILRDLENNDPARLGLHLGTHLSYDQHARSLIEKSYYFCVRCSRGHHATAGAWVAQGPYDTVEECKTRRERAKAPDMDVTSWMIAESPEDAVAKSDTH